MSAFVHLHLHSEYSLVDGLNRIKPLVKAAAAAGMPAVALTDQSNLFALVRFYKAAMGAGIKPIAGCDVWIHNPEDVNQPYRMVLLVQDATGYKNLTRLVSRSYRENQHLGRALLEKDWLTPETTQGLIALSGGRQGDVGRALLAGKPREALARLEHWLELFGDRYYLELIRTGRPDEDDQVQLAVDLAAHKGVPVVASNDVRFLKAEDFEAHEVRVCIHSGYTLDDKRRPKLYSEQQYLRTPEEMAELFADLPEALENSVEIAKRCNLELELGKACLPDFPIPDGMTMDQFFRAESEKGLEWRLESILDQAAPDYDQRRAEYFERLEIELDVIIQMGFPGYFLIVADFIQWAKDHDIPVGPGRGSGAGSLVAYVLKITDLDPLEHELLFERFLNPERVSMPDFDVDFCMDRRDEVIDYVADTYGRDSVSQIITYGSMAAKAVVRDVGRVQGHPFGFVDRVAKMVPFELGMTLDKALEESDDLKEAYARDEEIRDLIDMARKLEGLARNAGKHAGGVVISPGELTDFTPLYCEPGGDNLVTQFDKDDVEQAGLVKFDFLGLRTLTIIDWALQTINRERAQLGEPPVDINTIDMQDEVSFDLLKSAKTTAVFQLESDGMKKLIEKLQPDCFEDIVALVALFRPGPLGSGMVDDFIARKKGLAEVVYPHPELENILKPTYGTILYQEQVMQIAQVLAGYSLGGADLLRRAMGKKKQEVMDEQRVIFIEGSTGRGVDQDVAAGIFDLMAEFAKYGFNKSHSAAYALVSYQTLWLKAHYPAAFMAAVLSSDIDNTDKVVGFLDECRAMRLKIEPPNVNRSFYQFTIDGDQTVVYGLGAIKGVGEGAIEGVVEARQQGGEFSDLFDFCRRVDLKRLNRRTLEALIKAGALDQLGTNRASVWNQLPLAIKVAEKHEQDQNTGMMDMFGMAEPQAAGASSPPPLGVLPDDVPEWDDDQRLKGEKETLGDYLTGHPIDQHRAELRHFIGCEIGKLHLDERQKKDRRGKEVTVAGLVRMIARRNTQRGAMASVLLDDGTGRVEATLFSETFEKYRDLLTAEAVLIVEGNLVNDEYRGGYSVRANRVLTLEQARIERAAAIVIDLDANWFEQRGTSPNQLPGELAGWLTPARGGTCAVEIRYANKEASALLRLGADWAVLPTDELKKRLLREFGPDRLKIDFGAMRLRPKPPMAAVG